MKVSTIKELLCPTVREIKISLKIGIVMGIAIPVILTIIG